MLRALLIALLLSPAIVFARGCPVDAGFRGGGFHVGWEQRHLVTVAHGWKSLPPGVRASVREVLETHLGHSFARKLELDLVQTLDWQGLQRQFPSLYDQNRKRGAYQLLFRFSDRSRGLKHYYFEVFAEPDGLVPNPIPLPSIGAYPEKARLISCESARNRCVALGIPAEFSAISFEFSPKYNCFVWKVSDTRAFDPGGVPKGVYLVLELEAHSGQVLVEHIETIVI